MRTDPLSNPEPLIRRGYAYAAYRLGDRPDAEDAPHDTFERALRYRKTYDNRKGEPVSWLLGIARRCVDDVFTSRPPLAHGNFEFEAEDKRALEPELIDKLEMRAAVATLDPRSQELVALRYGADLTARQIAELLGERTNTIEVTLHRALGKLRTAL